MSNTIAHLAVARAVLQAWPALVQDADAYYLGSVAPDTIGSKTDCTREDKKRVHLREGLRDAEWLDDDKMQLFRERVQRFAEAEIRQAEGAQRDFAIGYLVHLLTDEWNHRTIRQTMLRLGRAQGVQESDRAFFRMMTNDLEALDQILLERDDEVAGILGRLLQQPARCALPGYIERACIDGSVRWWQSTYLPGIRQRKLTYVTESEIAGFVSIAGQKIVSALRGLIC